MDKTCLKLNRRFDSLTKQTHTTHNTEKKAHTFHSRVINLTNINFTREQINTLALGPIYAVEKALKHYISELIVDTENAIRQMEPNMQKTFRYLATKKIKQIMTTTTHNTLHKKYQHNVKRIRISFKKTT
jgi:hypothetical protein